MREREINKVQVVIREFGAEVCSVLPDAEACKTWLRNFHDGLVYGIKGRSEFADKLRDEASDYIQLRTKLGRLGGLAKSKISNGNPRPGESANLSDAPQTHKAAVPGDQAEGAESLPANGLDITEVYEFAEERHLDDIDCREWWEMTVRDRGGCDRDGNPILNWKGAVKSYCAAKAKRRAGR